MNLKVRAQLKLVTIHKSQGATYKDCVLNITKSMKRSLMYVGASRATKANELYVVGVFHPQEKPSENDAVSKELARLRMNPLVPCYQFLHDRDSFTGIQFMYHNIQGMTAHHEDLLADPCFMQSDLILLAETHTIYTDFFEIPGFEIASVIHSNKLGNKNRKPSGVITYIREGLADKSTKFGIMEDEKVQISISYILNNIRFAVIYASPRASTEYKLEKIIDALCDDEGCKTVLVGDFNIDFNSQEGQDFIEALKVIDLDLRTNPKHYTTRGYTTIDAIFSNKSMRTGVYMSIYSYHMPLYGRID